MLYVLSEVATDGVYKGSKAESINIFKKGLKYLYSMDYFNFETGTSKW